MFNRKALKRLLAANQEQEELIAQLMHVCLECGVPLPPVIPNGRTYIEGSGYVDIPRYNYDATFEALRKHRRRKEIANVVRELTGEQ